MAASNAPYHNHNLPNLGTAAATTLTIEQENRLGDTYMRVLRGQRGINNDPVLNEYLNHLGYRLVAHADNVRTPFQFFLVNSNDINAFAFFGGYIGVHTGLFLHAETESELASVMAHEIAHVTQRHLARSIEAQQRNSPASIAGIFGSILLALAAPEAGIAALQSTLALSQQASINYTRNHELEADRIGIKTLVAAGFDPQGVPSFFGKLMAQSRYASKPPVILLTHPLPESRIADSRTRADQYPAVNLDHSLMFALAKARIQARYARYELPQLLSLFEQQQRQNRGAAQWAALYGLTLVHLEQQHYEAAQRSIEALLKSDPLNLFYLDTYSDIMLATKQYDKAISALTAASANRPNNNVIEINLANAYLESGDAATAKRLLERHRVLQPNNSIVLSLLIEVYQQLDLRAERHMAQAELLALAANYQTAIDQLQYAYRAAQNDHLQLARIDARIKQLREAEQQMKAL